MPRQEYDIASFDELSPGTVRSVEVEGTAILLGRLGNEVFAVGATCPHAGGPLIDGIQREGRVVCPWHKATFCLRTGAVLEPPAVDPLPHFAVRRAGERILVTLPAEVPAETARSADPRCFVIVGAGAAGAVAAQTLREIGFGGRIVMLDRENRVPYDRTLLSKYVLSGESGAEKSPLQKQSFYRQHQIERRTAEVMRLDWRNRRVLCADGSALDYDAILLASGGVARRPSIPGAELGNVFLLRSRADADALLAQAERSETAVVLGTGFIGMEVAASLRERGLDVTVIGQETVPFEKQLGVAVGKAFLSLHSRHGVGFRLGRRVAALEGGPHVRSVRLDDGEILAADLVVLGAGIEPATRYAGDLPVESDGGVTVDDQLRAAENVYAAGDIARFPYRGTPIRVEHWRVAEQHGRVAARNMAGQAARYDAVPVFWTIQYLKRLDYIGHAESWDEIVVYGDLRQPAFLAYYVVNGRVAAAAGFDRDKDTAALVELLTMRQDWTAAELGDSPSTVLASPPYGK